MWDVVVPAPPYRASTGVRLCVCVMRACCVHVTRMQFVWAWGGGWLGVVGSRVRAVQWLGCAPMQGTVQVPRPPDVPRISDLRYRGG